MTDIVIIQLTPLPSIVLGGKVGCVDLDLADEAKNDVQLWYPFVDDMWYCEYVYYMHFDHVYHQQIYDEKIKHCFFFQTSLMYTIYIYTFILQYPPGYYIQCTLRRGRTCNIKVEFISYTHGTE